MTLEDRYQAIAQEYMNEFVCRECGSPLIVTVSRYGDGLLFKCSNPNCYYNKVGYTCNESIARYKDDKL